MLRDPSPLVRRSVIFILAWYAWAPTLNLPFIWDDHFTIEKNSAIRHWSMPNVKHDFTSGFFNDPLGTDFYRPLVAFVNRVDYSLYGQNAWGYHLTNLLMHAMTSVLVSELMLLLGFPALLGVIAGSLFAVHPANVQDMVMVSGRCGLMGTLWAFLSLALLMRGGVARAAGYLAFAMALLSKESTVITPLLLLLLSWVRRKPAGLVPQLSILLTIAGLYWTLRTQVMGPLLEQSLVTLSGPFVLQAFPSVLFHYASLTLFPWPLYAERILPSYAAVWPYALAGGLVLVTMVSVLSWKNVRWPAFSLAWAVLWFIPPMAVMISKSLLQDHWLYPALPGFLLPLAWGIHRGLESTRRAGRIAAGILGMGLLVGWVVLARANIELRKTDEKFFSWSARFNTSATIHDNLRALRETRR